MRRLILAFLALCLLSGCAVPSAPQVESISAPVVVSAPLELDEYPSETEPSGIRGLTVGDLLHDVWISDGYTPNPDAVVVPEYVASFDGTPPTTFDATHYRVPSIQFPGVVHVLRMVYVTKA